jgi:hypothetical protein
VALRKPSDFFVKKTEETNLPVIETDNTLREELIKVESLSEQIFELHQELSQKVVKNDLESLVLSQINTMQENFKNLQNEFKQSNERDIGKFREGVSQLAEIVGDLVENEIPKYKKQIISTDIRIGEKFDNFKEVVDENINDIREDVETKVENIASVVDDNLGYFNQQLQETSSGVKQTVDTYNKLSKIVESRIERENEQLEEYSKIIQSLHEAFIELETSLQEEVSASLQKVEEQIESYKNEITSEQLSSEKKLETYKNELEISVDNRLENYQKELKDVKADVVIAEQRIRNVDNYLKENHQELIELREEVFAEIEKLPLGDVQENVRKLERKLEYIEEVYKNIEPEVIVKEVIQEGLLNDPPNTKNSDPLTPLDKNFVTLDQLQQHYRLFINRIQQQLTTIGGGGETRLEFLDDVNRDSVKQDGYILQYSSTEGKFIGTSYVPGGGGGGGNANYANVAGIATYAITSGISTYATSSGIATYAITAGISTYATSSGIATYASTAGVATALQNIRTFQITGDIIASPITFDGTGNVSLAATIQPNSVALGGDTSGDYVQSIAGTSNQIDVSATSGEGSTPTLSIPNQFTIPQDATVTRDLQVNRNLNVNGNITLGGTTAFINVQQLRVSDADIILGIRTDAFGNDISNDTTANHGGIAVASTEGSPLININIVGIETLPPTYKKIMWFESGAFAGLGTDAWLINYGVGIGSTQFPSGTRLAAGSVQFTEQDLAVVRNINASGIVTATTFIGNLTGTATTANYALIAGVSTSVIGGIASVTQLNVTGVTTLGILTVGNVFSTGIITATSFSGDGSQLTGVTASAAVSISTNTTNTNQLIPYATSFGSTTGFGATTLLVYNPSTGNLGIGTTLPTSKLSVDGDVNVTGVVTATSFSGKVRENVVSINTNYSVQLSDSVILSTETSIITMPSAVGLLGDKYYIKNAGVGTVTIKPSGSELIDDYTEMILSEKNSSLTLISNNSKWLIF